MGINENNSIVINNGGTQELFFPVTPFMFDTPLINTWVTNRYINILYQGWAPSHNAAVFGEYLDDALAAGVSAIGPHPEWWSGLGKPADYERNSNMNELSNYIEYSRDHPALAMWVWDDEPDSGGSGGYTPAPVLRGRTKLTHELDPKHPVIISFMPYFDDRTDWRRQTSDKFSYLYGEDQYGKKTLTVEVGTNELIG